MPLRVMIIAGESSGELYGALLAKKLREKWPNLFLLGVGGKKMETEGVELVAGITGAFGIFGAISSIKTLFGTYRKLIKIFKTKRIDVLVLIDFPDFNLFVAKAAKKYGIKVLYYVSPQVWAWRTGRIKKIAARSHIIAAILPFEPEMYEKAGTDCEFVGHPAMEELLQHVSDAESLKAEFSINPDAPVFGIFPGSRHGELKRHLPVIVDTIKTIKAVHPEFQFVIALAPNLHIEKYKAQFTALNSLGVKFVAERSLDVLAVSDVALMKSGTAAFQAALMGVPLVVFYKMPAVEFRIAKMIIDVSHINLANLIMEREVVKELIQNDATSAKISAEILALYEDSAKRQAMTDDFKRLRALFESKNPTDEVVKIIANLTGD
ncbi:MAG: lipid-A-disaccharide synthase [Nitrospirae bacterium]|nr:lipid-A-disaccharide synthase [Nitrospirota bacterium]